MKKSKIDPAELKRNIERATLRRIGTSLWPYRRHSSWVFITILAGAVLNLTPSIFLKELVDRAIPAKDTALVLYLAGGMIAGPLIAGLLGVLDVYKRQLQAMPVLSLVHPEDRAATQRDFEQGPSRCETGCEPA